MSNASKIIRLFTSNTYPRKLKERVWKWLLSSADAEEKGKAMLYVWTESSWKADKDTQLSYTKFCTQTASRTDKKQLLLHRLFRTVAILLLPLLTGAAVYFYTITSQPLPIEFLQCIVPEGEYKEITLSDGSQIQINGGSMIIYPNRFDGDTRSLFLAGEARFNVTKDEKHPFVVKTSCLNVKVLGTTFNLKAYLADTKTIATLETGEVSVWQPNGTILANLLPNEQIEYDNRHGTFNKKPIDASLYSGWTSGELNFVSQSIKEIMMSLERSYGITILIPPVLINSDLYTIKFKRRKSIDEVMNIVTKTIGDISYQLVNETTISIYPLSNPQKGKNL